MKMQISVREYAFRHKMLPQAVYQKIWGGKLTATREDGRWLIEVDEQTEGPEQTTR